MEQKKAICRLTEKFKGLLQKSKKNPNRVSGASLKTYHLKKELVKILRSSDAVKILKKILGQVVQYSISRKKNVQLIWCIYTPSRSEVFSLRRTPTMRDDTTREGPT